MGNITIVYIVNGVYKPTFNCGGTTLVAFISRTSAPRHPFEHVHERILPAGNGWRKDGDQDG